MKIIKVLWLDDQTQMIEDVRYNICSLGSEFFKSIGTEIDKIDIDIIAEPDEAFKIINNKKNSIDLLILDIELKYNKQGHEEYHRLFYTGKAIPAIVVSAFASSPKRIEEIYAKGISIIIDKWEPEKLSEEIAEKICKVFNSPKERIVQIRNIVEELRLHHNTVNIEKETKTIQEWLQLIITGKLSKERESSIKDAIANECIKKSRLEADHNKGFTRSNN